MTEGLAYALVALTLVVLVIGGYLAYLIRRANIAMQELLAGTRDSSKGEGSATFAPSSAGSGPPPPPTDLLTMSSEE